MLVLWEASPRTVGALGEALDLDSSTLTPLLKRLEPRRPGRPPRDPEDERRVIVALTTPKAARCVTGRTMPEQLFCKLTCRWSRWALRERLKTLAK
jgi:DNA-binding MarR family transcriptional regulator